VLSQVDAGLDLNHFSQIDTPTHIPTALSMLNYFGFGGGGVGEITMADFFGTLGGYIHVDAISHIVKCEAYLGTLPEGKELARRYQILTDLLQGKYTIPGQLISEPDHGGGG
jgi:hypothetical protein